MAEKSVHLALFNEDQVDHASEALAKLRELGVPDREISVISGVPFSERVLGRPMAWTRITQIGIGGAIIGFILAAFLAWGTTALYPLKVGRLPLYPIPTSIVVLFEITMLGLLISTFIGVFVETISPSFGPRGYHPSVTDGRIGILFSTAEGEGEQVENALKELGADIEEVHKP